MNLKEYWNLPPATQTAKRNLIEETEKEAQLTAYLQEHQMVLHPRTGKPIKPEDYPCRCLPADPNYCYDETHEVEVQDGMNGTCDCPCHTYYEPF